MNKYSQSVNISKTLIFYLFLLGVCLIPYDKLPFLDYSTYSPSAIFPFLGAFFWLMITKHKIDKNDFWLILFCFISIIHSLLSGIVHQNLIVALKHIVTLIVGTSIFFTVRYVFTELLHKNESRIFENILFLSLIIPIFLGYVQLINQLGFANNFATQLTSLFAKNVYEGRIQMVSSEPSWATIHLLTLGVIVFVLKSRGKKFLYLFVFMLILFVSIFSLYGYGVIIMSFILFGLLATSIKNRFKIIVIIVSSLIIIFFFIPWVLQIFDIYGYYVSRFDYRYLFSSEFLREDGSAFVRIVFPLIGVMQFLDNPFGTGGGFYYINFAQYLEKYFSYGLVFPEVVYNTFVNPENANPRNLYVKLLSEEGIVNTSIFLIFLVGVLKKCRENYSKYAFCLAVSLLVNFDSYAFVDFWFLLAVASSGYLDNVKGKDERQCELLLMQENSQKIKQELETISRI